MSSYKDIFTNLLVKTHFVEEKDEREYDYEGDMAKSQLKSIITNAQRLHDMLEDDTNLPEWVQLKITLAEDYVVTAANYMEGEEDLDEEIEQIDELKKSTLASYVKGATRDVASASRLQRGYETDAARSEFAPVQRGSELAAKNMRKFAGKRSRGIARAVDKLAKEEVEQIDELDVRGSPLTRAKMVANIGKNVIGAGINVARKKPEEARQNLKTAARLYAASSRMRRETDPNKSRQYKSAAASLRRDLGEEVEQVDEAQKKLKPSYWKAEWRLGTQSEVDKNNKKIYDKLAKTDPDKAKKFHDNLMKIRKEEVETVEEGAKDWKKAFMKKARSNLNKDTSALKAVSKYGLMSKSHFDNEDDVKHILNRIKHEKTIKVDEEVTYFSGTTVSGKAWKFIPPAEPKMLSPEFVKDRVPTLTDKEAHEVSVVAKDQYDDVAKKFAEMSEAKAGTVPKTPREKELAAKAHPKHLITRKDVLHARGVKLGEEELREKIREKLGSPGKTMTKKPADPVVFHPMGKKKPVK